VTDLLDQLNNLWNQAIDLTSRFVIPDWGGLIALLPVVIFVFVVGPAVTLGVFAWFVFVVRKPRARVQVEEGPRAATIGADGAPAYPPGLPYCAHDRLVFSSGSSRCSECRNELTVICPMCGLGREAAISTCGNCGLVLRVESRARIMRPAGPPPGGAAVA
jgi:hypothetical protein